MSGGFGVSGVGFRVWVCWDMCGIVFSIHIGAYVTGARGVQLSLAMYRNNRGGVHIHHSTGQEQNRGYRKTPGHGTDRTRDGFTLNSVVALNHTTKVDTGTPRG